MKTSTKGHMATQGGIRGHSAGDIFPYVIYIKGDDAYQLIGNGIKADDNIVASRDNGGYEYLIERAIVHKESLAA
jgi:hypothetical protein